MLNVKFVLLIALLVPQFAVAIAVDPMVDVKIRLLIVEEAIHDYLTNNGQYSCPCPYSTKHGGEFCSLDSAYFFDDASRHPKCYTSDVSFDEVERYRSKHHESFH